MTGRFAASLALWCGCFMSSATSAAQQSAPKAPILLQVTLEVPLDTLRLQAGAPVLASALVPWEGPDCLLKTGSTVYGRITEVTSRHKGQRESSLKVLFDRADCNGRRSVPITLVVFAVMNSADDPSGGQTYSSQLFGTTSLHGVMNSASNRTAPVDNRVLNQSVGLASAAADTSLRALTSVKSGEVVDAAKVTLTVGTGADNPSVLRSDKRDFEINRNAELVLLPVLSPKSSKPVLAKREEAALTAALDKPQPVQPPDVIEVCAAGECNDLSTGVREVEGAVRSIPLAQLGYRPRRAVQMSAFDRDTTITFLSAQQILVTFDMHRLRSREGWPTTVRRVVRAVLLDATTGKVERVSDWTVEGGSQYLWSAGPGRVLVHMGGALQLFGPDLAAEAILPARGDLLWVSASPAGKRIAVAVLHERHTRETHDQMASLSSVTPAEDVDVCMFDHQGTLRFCHADTSQVPAPVLTDDGGEIMIRRERGQRWQILEQGAETTHAIANINSSCTPVVYATSTDGLFVQGCTTGGRWSRMIHRNGRTFMKFAASDNVVEQRAVASGDRVYAVRIVELLRAPDAQFTFPATSLRDEKISVRRSSDGHELMLARVERFPQTRSSFALSTDEKQLALLTEGEVAIYLLPSDDDRVVSKR